MVLANIEYFKRYSSVYDFTEDNLEKVKKCLKKEVKGLKFEDEDQEYEVIAKHLIELGICDEDVINEVLKADKEKWFVIYVDDGNLGYFDIYKVLK